METRRSQTAELDTIWGSQEEPELEVDQKGEVKVVVREDTEPSPQRRTRQGTIRVPDLTWD